MSSISEFKALAYKNEKAKRGQKSFKNKQEKVSKGKMFENFVLTPGQSADEMEKMEATI